MLSSLWKYVAGALAFISAILGATLLYTSGQKERAKEAATVAKAQAKSKGAVLNAERAIDKAREQSRQKAAEVEREQMAKRQSGRRPIVFGDERLRMHDNRDGNDQA